MCCARLAGNAGPKKLPKIRHLGTIAQLCWAISLQLRHVLTVRKKRVKQQYLLHVLTIWWASAHYVLRSFYLVWGTPVNFNGFCVLISLRQWRLTEANQTAWCLAVSWADTLYIYIYIYTFGDSCPLTEFCHVQHSLCPSLALSYFGGVTARHSSSVRQPNFAALNRGRHLYSAITLGIGPHSSC